MFIIKISFDIDSYKTKFTGGVKQYLFYALFDFPDDIKLGNTDFVSSLLKPLGYGSSNNVLPYLVRSTSLPDSSFEEILIPYPGLPIKMAGSRSFGDWNVSFNVDAEGTLLHYFNGWHEIMYDTTRNLPGSKNIYAKTHSLYILDNNGVATECIKLYNAWPKVIGQVGFDYSSSDIATIDITFSYDYYTITREQGTSPTNTILQSAINAFTGKSFGGMF